MRFSRSDGWFKKHHVDAVRGASLQLRRGETLGVVGESGSGKTTLAMALLALQPMVGGEVLLGGQRVDTAGRAVAKMGRK